MVNNDIADFEICGFDKSTKFQISQEKTFFLQLKKSLITHEGLPYGKKVL